MINSETLLSLVSISCLIVVMYISHKNGKLSANNARGTLGQTGGRLYEIEGDRYMYIFPLLFISAFCISAAAFQRFRPNRTSQDTLRRIEYALNGRGLGLDEYLTKMKK